MPTSRVESLSDADLLRQFVDSRSPQAFAAFVERYLPLIYSSALRQTRDPHLAEDIAQATLIVFSKRAARIDPPILVGWLLKTTHFVARNALRQQFRRARHEQRAAAMKSETQRPTESPDADAISKVIDPALAKLRVADRTAVVLRYFKNKSFADIAASMNTTEAAVQKRVSRAVQKLRDILAGQGITVAPAALPALLASQKLLPVPQSLSLHAATLSSAKSTSTSFLAKGAIKAMAATAKLKITTAVIVVLLLVGTAIPIMYHCTHRAAQEIVVEPPIAWLPKGIDLSKPVSGSLPPTCSATPIAITQLADGRWMTPTGDVITNGATEFKEELRELKGVSRRPLVASKTYSFVLRTSRPASSGAKLDATIQYHLGGASTIASTGWRDMPPADPKTETCNWIELFNPEPGADSITPSVDVADGPRTNACVISASAVTPVQGAVLDFAFTMLPPKEDQKGVQIIFKQSLSLDQKVEFLDINLYAINLTGKEVYPNSGKYNAQNGTFGFAGTLADYKEFRLDARPYNYHATYAAVPLPR